LQDYPAALSCSPRRIAGQRPLNLGKKKPPPGRAAALK
jgi:hypothetical protein